MFKYKLKAFALHFSLSLIIVLISIFIVWFIWYPEPLYKAAGVTRIVLIVLAIGLIVGPSLTFVVSKPNKKSLRFDLVIIVILQLTGFFYGLYQVYDGRPAWIAYNVDRFDLVKNNEIDNRKLIEALSTYQKVSNSGARYVAAIIPQEDSKISNQILLDEVNYGIAPSQRPELFQPLSAVDDLLVTRAKSINELYDYNDKIEVDNILSAYPRADGFLPLKANAVDMTVLINTDKQPKVIKIVDLRPWE